MSEDRPEPDRIEGAPHPRATLALFGLGLLGLGYRAKRSKTA